MEYFPGFNTLQLSQQVKGLLLRLNETTENFTGRTIVMSMFNDISCGSRDNEKECESNAQLVSLYAKRFGIGQWSFLGPGSEGKWFSVGAGSPRGEWDGVGGRDVGSSRKAGIQFSVMQVHCPEVNSEAKAVENCRDTFVLIWIRLKLFFAQLLLSISSVFTEQSHRYVKNSKPFTIERGNPLSEGDRSAFGL